MQYPLRNGLPWKGGRPRVSLRDRVFANLVITDAPTGFDVLGRPLVGPCLVWTRGATRGYGGVFDPDKNGSGGTRRVHRVMYEWFVGPIEDELDHLCRVTRCASPAHLEDVTQDENNARRIMPTGPRGPKKNKPAHCPRGHEFSEENTRMERRPDGTFSRKCRACAAARATARRHAKSGGVSRHHRDKTHCPQGHPYDEANTYRGKNGRFCRACGREATKRYLAKKKQSGA